jgi:hypothetical protein
LSAQVRELKALLLRAEANAEEERKRASAIERRALKAEKAQARLRKKEEDDTKQLNDVVQVCAPFRIARRGLEPLTPALCICLRS